MLQKSSLFLPKWGILGGGGARGTSPWSLEVRWAFLCLQKHQKKRWKSLKTWNCVQIKGASPMHEFCLTPIFEHSFTFWAVFGGAKESRYRSWNPPPGPFRAPKVSKNRSKFQHFFEGVPGVLLESPHLRFERFLTSFWLLFESPWPTKKQSKLWNCVHK